MSEKDPKPVSKNDARVAPRVRILPLHDISFIADESSKKIVGVAPVRVNNISESGVGFIVPQIEKKPDIGVTFSGSFHFGIQTTKETVEVVHATPKIMGCRFVGEPGKISDLVNQYFDLEISALKMIKVNPSMLKKTDEGNAHWYKGGTDSCELYFIENDGQLCRFHFSFLGNHVDAVGDNVRYGTLVDESRDGLSYKGSGFVRWQETIPTGFAHMAEKFVSNVKELSPEIRSQLLHLVKSLNA